MAVVQAEIMRTQIKIMVLERSDHILDISWRYSQLVFLINWMWGVRKISDVSKIFGLSKQKNEFPIKCYVKVCSCRSLGNGVIRKSVQFSRSVVSYCKPMDCSMPDFLSVTNSQRLLKLMSVESVMPSNCLILWHPLLLLPPNFPSIKVFSSESVLRIR